MEEQIKKLKRQKSKDDDIIVTKKSKIDLEGLMVSILRPTKLYIGTCKFEPSNYGDELVARAYFVKKQLTWEILSNKFRRKIEIEWSSIVGIRASLTDNEPGILQVELSQPPKFYKQLENVEQRQHEKWVAGSDFTGGEAANCREHYVMFPPGILDEHFVRLINFDKRLWELSQMSYPTSNQPYFKMPCNLRVPTQQNQPSYPNHQRIAYGAPTIIPPGPATDPLPVTTNFNTQQSSGVGDDITYLCNNVATDLIRVSDGWLSSIRSTNSSYGISNACFTDGRALYYNDLLPINGPSDSSQRLISNGHLENNNHSAYFNSDPNSFSSDWPTDSRGVWLPPWSAQGSHL